MSVTSQTFEFVTTIWIAKVLLSFCQFVAFLFRGGINLVSHGPLWSLQYPIWDLSIFNYIRWIHGVCWKIINGQVLVFFYYIRLFHSVCWKIIDGHNLFCTFEILKQDLLQVNKITYGIELVSNIVWSLMIKSRLNHKIKIAKLCWYFLLVLLKHCCYKYF